MDPKQALDLEILQALVKIPLALVFVGHAHLCGIPGVEPRTPEEQAVCASYPHPVEDPRHFVLKPIVRIEESPHTPGLYRAYTPDESFMEATPSALLSHLRRAAQALQG